MIKLIPFDKIFENSAGIVLLLAKQSNCCSYFSGFCHSGNLKIECLYIEVKPFHFITFLVSRCNLAYGLFF